MNTTIVSPMEAGLAEFLRGKMRRLRASYTLAFEAGWVAHASAAQPQGEIETLRAALRTEVEAGDSWRREALELRGLTPALPPRPPNGDGMPRYGLRWNGPQQPLAVAMSDGYWTPWHLAERRVEVLEGLLREMTAGYRSREHFMKYAPWTNDNDLRERVADFAYPANEGASHE